MSLKSCLYLAHRWLGLILGLQFVLWFGSGIIMMYVPYPELTLDERLTALPPLDLSKVNVNTINDISHNLVSESILQARLNSAFGRPVFHFLMVSGHWQSVFADDGTLLESVTPSQSLESAHYYGQSGHPSHTNLLERDQWSISSNLDAYRPLHHIQLNDTNGTELYVSARTGEIVRDSTTFERGWNWVGAIVHWLYPLPLRQHRELWRQVIMVISASGFLLALSGLCNGLRRFRMTGVYRNSQRKTPYSGVWAWHHLSGLLFGVVILAWVFSGFLSVNPGGYFPDTAPANDELARLQGKSSIDPADFSGLINAWTKIRGNLHVKEIELSYLDGKAIAVFHQDAKQSVLIESAETGSNNFKGLQASDLAKAASKIKPDSTILDTELLPQGDFYYYAHHKPLKFPVFRIQFDDADSTWYYLDTQSGKLQLKLTAAGRIYRWLFNALHSWDYPLLIQHRPAWDLLVILF